VRGDSVLVTRLRGLEGNGSATTLARMHWRICIIILRSRSVILQKQAGSGFVQGNPTMPPLILLRKSTGFYFLSLVRTIRPKKKKNIFSDFLTFGWERINVRFTFRKMVVVLDQLKWTTTPFYL
jgi:hypothetical protein